MATVLPFRALRPNPALVEKVASPPYDVLSSDEARQIAQDNPHSFLHIIKPEIDLAPDVDPYSDEVYNQGANALKNFIDTYILLQDDESCYYLYQQIMGDHVQTGFVGLASVDEYDQGLVKKHEYTRPDKVKDRVRLMTALNAQTGPVFLAYRQTDDMQKLVTMLLQKSLKVCEFVSFHEVKHIFYKVDYEPYNELIKKAFAAVPALYIADGHHRSESASVLCAQKRQERTTVTGDEPFNFFLTVTFPDTDLMVLPYNRVVHDLNGHSKEEFMAKVEEKFEITAAQKFDGVKEQKTFGMYIDGSWFHLKIKAEYVDSDAVKSLDVSILQDNLLFPILNIDDPRTNKRIDFIGGIRGDKELQRLVDSGDCAVAFSLYPTSMQQVMDVADAGKVMPPKSTWFEPKLLSGMATHLLD
jgi:uncharacterized protein (DUF1015 family)